jgi:hypothetical protein
MSRRFAPTVRQLPPLGPASRAIGHLAVLIAALSLLTLAAAVTATAASAATPVFAYGNATGNEVIGQQVPIPGVNSLQLATR